MENHSDYHFDIGSNPVSERVSVCRSVLSLSLGSEGEGTSLEEGAVNDERYFPLPRKDEGL